MFSNRAGGSNYANPVHRFPAQRVMNLVEELAASERQSFGEEEDRIREKRRMHHSLSVSASRRQQFNNRARFNNKTREG
jgi:hypothetical protein